MEVFVDGQGHLARPGTSPRRHRCALQPHHGPVREVRHDVQRRRVLSLASSSPGKYSGQDNGWVMSMVYPPLIEFDKSIIKYPNIRRYPGGASNDLRPNLQDPSNPVPAMDPNKPPRIGGSGG